MKVHIFVHKSVTWVITLGVGGGAKLTMGIRNFNLRTSEVRKRGKFGLNQSLIHIHPFLTQIVLFAPLQI
jgi:cyanate permease